jgi:putative transposase
MKETRWTTSNKAVFNIGYHLIWCTKYRRKLLTGEIEARLKILLIGKAEDIGLSVETMEIMPDHVHLFVRASPVDSPHYIVQQFKGMTSRILRSEFPEIKRRVPTLWTRSYYCESIGHISAETVQRYIEDQKKH